MFCNIASVISGNNTMQLSKTLKHYVEGEQPSKALCYFANNCPLHSCFQLHTAQSDYIEIKYANRDNPVKLKELSEKAAKHILSASKWLALAEWNIDNKYTEEIDIKLVGKELLSKYANEFKNIQLL
jgi:hypothetical protein